jgi:hypothetical protein
MAYELDASGQSRLGRSTESGRFSSDRTAASRSRSTRWACSATGRERASSRLRLARAEIPRYAARTTHEQTCGPNDTLPIRSSHSGLRLREPWHGGCPDVRAAYAVMIANRLESACGSSVKRRQPTPRFRSRNRGGRRGCGPCGARPPSIGLRPFPRPLAIWLHKSTALVLASFAHSSVRRA